MLDSLQGASSAGCPRELEIFLPCLRDGRPRSEGRRQAWIFPRPVGPQQIPPSISAVARSILRLHPARAHHAPAAKCLEQHEHAGTNQRAASPDIPKANRDATKKTETTQRPANDAAGATNVWVEEFRHGQEVAYPQANATWDKKPQAGLLPPAALCSYSSSVSLSVPTSTAGCWPWWKIA